MKQLASEIIIDAPAAVIWEVLMDTDSYHQWNPFIQSINGSLKVGEKIAVLIQLEGKKAQLFRPRVLTLESAKELRWLGHLWVPGLFDGEHYFQLDQISATQTRFRHGENFRGILSGLIMNMVGEETRQGFEAMNAALKQRAERLAISA